jgi:hypothetical protein
MHGAFALYFGTRAADLLLPKTNRSFALESRARAALDAATLEALPPPVAAYKAALEPRKVARPVETTSRPRLALASLSRPLALASPRSPLASPRSRLPSLSPPLALASPRSRLALASLSRGAPTYPAFGPVL